MNALRLSFHARRARPRDPRPTARDDVRARAMDGPRAVRAIEGSLRFAFATIAGVARADDCAARDPPPRTRRERDPTCRGLADWSCDATWCRSLQTIFTHHSVSIFDRVAFQLTDIYH
jgi:hypothetical protein